MQECALLPFNAKKIRDVYFIANRLGAWDFLTRDEFMKASRMDIDAPLREKLEKSGMLMTEKNCPSIISGFMRLNRNLYMSPSLHIVILTSKCNYRCAYCHAGSREKSQEGMTEETAAKVLNRIFDSPSRAVTIEFQGGESSINWETLEFMVKSAGKLNRIENKDLKMVLVSNMSLLGSDRIAFLVKNNVRVCTSLDGPKEIHDSSRAFADGKGTYGTTVNKINELNAAFGKEKRMVSALPTITRKSLGSPKEIVDEYVKHGFGSIHIRPLTPLGSAAKNWGELGYSPEEFVEFWKKCLDYIIELNEKGASIQERTARILCSKLLKSEDPLYTEIMSPCGAGRCQTLYCEDGTVMSCDEARDIEEGYFSLGHVSEPYEKLMGSSKMFNICQASILDSYDPASPYVAFLGFCPVQSMALQKNMLPKLKSDFGYRILEMQMDYVLGKILDGKREIFIKWLSN